MGFWGRTSERGNFSMPLAVIIVLVVVMVFGYFVLMGGSGSQPADEQQPAGTDGAGGEAEAPLDTRWATIAELEERQGLELTHWTGVLTCLSLSDREPFERDVSVWVGDNGVFYERLAAAEFAEFAAGELQIPREYPDTFEWWRGTYAGTKVEIEGWYREGTDRVKPVFLIGGIHEGYMFLEGERGPRECTYEASRDGADQGSTDDWGGQA